MEIINKDLIIIGAGPAGLSAGIYAGRAGLDVLVMENELVGGQLTQSSIIENYPGVLGISGAELSGLMRKQALDSGALIEEFDVISEVDLTSDEKIIRTSSKEYHAKAVIIATGASPKKLMVDGEDEFSGKGVHYCALCDGFAYKNKVVAVIGGGNSALEEALYLSKIAAKVIIIRRKENFNGENALLESIKNTSNIEILYNTDIVSFGGNKALEYAVISDTKTLEQKNLAVDGVFIYVGRQPQTELFGSGSSSSSDIGIEISKAGYIITDDDFETSIKGVFAAGDIREKRYRQIVTAAADGACAALSAKKYIGSYSKN